MAPRFALFNDTSVTDHFGCTAVMQVLIEAMTSRGASVDYRWPVALDWQPEWQALAEHKVDAIIVNGEGSIHHSKDRPRARQLCALGPFARNVLGVPAHLLNASVEALEAREIENLRSFSTISVRERRSQAYLAGHGIAAEVVGDLSLSIRAPVPSERHGILVTDSVLRDVSVALNNSARVAGARFERMRPRRKLIQRIKRKLSVPTKVIKTPLEPARQRALQDFLTRVARAEAVLTGRFHSVCLCLVTGTPVLAVPSNTHKITGLLEDAFGHNERIVSAEALPDLALRAELFAWNSGEKLALSRFLQETRAAQAGLFDRIVEG